MAGGQITYEFGYCPYDYAPQCCAVTVSPQSVSLSRAWNVSCTGAYAAVTRLLLVSILAAAFRLRSTSQPVDDSRSNAVMCCTAILGETDIELSLIMLVGLGKEEWPVRNAHRFWGLRYDSRSSSSIILCH